MGNTLQLTAADGHIFEAYIAQPTGKPLGGLVLLQEIFGVNAHIKEVADDFAKQGYLVIAPPTMSRIQKDVNLGYTEADMQAGFKLKLAVEQLNNSPVMLDIQAAINAASSAGKVGIAGYCWGGLVTWRSACALKGLSAAVAYYGGGVPNESQLNPSCPVMAHFGDQDAYIPLDSVSEFQKAQPQVVVHIYNANHGFNCNHRGSYNESAAQLAKERTLSFLKENLS